jgi:perosamine synthetase
LQHRHDSVAPGVGCFGNWRRRRADHSNVYNDRSSQRGPLHRRPASPVDSEPVTWNIDPWQIESRVGPKTEAIIAAHTYGCPADAESIGTLARKHRLRLIEDAAEAHGASCRGKPVGSLGDIAAFSFYANKIITTGGGEMVTTSNRALADKARKLRGHAFSEVRHL